MNNNTISQALYIANKLVKQEKISKRFYTLKQKYLEDKIKTGEAKVVSRNSTQKTFYGDDTVSVYGHDYATVEFEGFKFHLKYDLDECPFLAPFEDFNINKVTSDIDFSKVSISVEQALEIIKKIGYSERIKTEKFNEVAYFERLKEFRIAKAENLRFEKAKKLAQKSLKQKMDTVEKKLKEAVIDYVKGPKSIYLNIHAKEFFTSKIKQLKLPGVIYKKEKSHGFTGIRVLFR